MASTAKKGKPVSDSVWTEVLENEKKSNIQWDVSGAHCSSLRLSDFPHDYLTII